MSDDRNVPAHIDLHAHTTASDGALTPAQLVGLARDVDLSVLAITDHDTVAGIAAAIESAAGVAGLEVWPGVEMSADVPNTEVHILGYFVDYADPGLLSTLTTLRLGRTERARGMVVKLKALGIDVSYDRVVELAGVGAVGRPHIARALLEAGYVADFREAFDRFLGRNAPAYVERPKLSPADAVGLIRSAGGMAVLAHPWYIGSDANPGPSVTYKAFVPELLEAGLTGIEVYYPDTPADFARELLTCAREHGLIATGGTDFHSQETSKCLLGDIRVPESTVAAMRAWRDARFGTSAHSDAARANL